MGLFASAVYIIPRLQDLPGHMHLPLEDQRAMKIVMGVSWLHVSRRELGELVHPLGDLVFPLGDDLNLNARWEPHDLMALRNVLPLDLIRVDSQKFFCLLHTFFLLLWVDGSSGADTHRINLSSPPDVLTRTL